MRALLPSVWLTLGRQPRSSSTPSHRHIQSAKQVRLLRTVFTLFAIALTGARAAVAQSPQPAVPPAALSFGVYATGTGCSAEAADDAGAGADAVPGSALDASIGGTCVGRSGIGADSRGGNSCK